MANENDAVTAANSTVMESTLKSEESTVTKSAKKDKKAIAEAERVKIEIQIIMKLPEVKLELLPKANPNNFDLY